MNILLEHIGIIEEADVILEGLTVISGKNNSGKTTVGKVLYSLIDAVANLVKNSEADKISYIQRQLGVISNIWRMFSVILYSPSDKNNDTLSDFPNFKQLFFGGRKRFVSLDEIKVFAMKVRDELISLEASDIGTSELLNFYLGIDRNADKSSFEDRFNDQKEDSLSILDNMFIDIEKDKDLVHYTRERINQTLLVEFSNQIQPVKKNVKNSKVMFYDERDVFFKFNIVDNRIIDEKKPVFFGSPFNKVHMIDDPYALDEEAHGRFNFHQDEIKSETILNFERIDSHRDKLRRVLRSKSQTSVFEKLLLFENLNKLQEKINDVIPGEFDFNEDGEFYVDRGKKLQLSNLATGSKLFAMLKILLEKGEITNSTLLILDEPEAHLHPEWQNALAEVIILLVKELEVCVLLTTHSTNFLLALDAYMRKYNISNQTNFYQTETLDNGLVRYKCVNEDLGEIYKDFYRYLAEMKVLRDYYLFSRDESDY